VTQPPGFVSSFVSSPRQQHEFSTSCSRGHLKCDGRRTESRFLLSAKRTSLFKSAGASLQSTTGSRVVRINGSNTGYIMFRGSVKSTGYPIHSPVSPSLPLLCVTVFHHISTGVYQLLGEYALPQMSLFRSARCSVWYKFPKIIFNWY